MILDDRDQYTDNKENREQSRILWIVLSALTVIAIVLAAGLFFFFPSDNGTTGQPRLSSLSGKPASRDFDHVEYVRNGEGYPEMVNPAETADEFSVDSPSEEPVEAETIPAVEEPEAVQEETNVKEVTTPADTPAKTVEEKAIPVAPVKKVPETRKVSVTVYWIQVGSYTDLTKAEEVRTYLLSRDISSEVQTRSVDGKTYYRVRIGAFQSKGEADKFLEPIRDMKNFEESYVVQTTMIREVPVN